MRARLGPLLTLLLSLGGLGAPALASPDLVSAQAAPNVRDARLEARQRFQHGAELYDEGQYDQALAEFQRAYEIAPEPQVLLGLGQVHAQLGHAVESIDALEQFLRTSGGRLRAERRAEAEALLARQRGRVAYVEVASAPPGATVYVDDVNHGAPGTAPIRVTIGTRVIEVRAPGHETYRTSITIAAGLTERVEVEMEASGGEPEPAPAPAPRVVDPNGGTLVMQLPEPPSHVWIDGQEVEWGPRLVVPAGTHTVEVDVAQRERFVGQVTLESRQVVTYTPRLTWSDLELRQAAARQQVVDGWITFGVGAGVLAAGAGFMMGLLAEQDAQLNGSNVFAATAVPAGTILVVAGLITVLAAKNDFEVADEASVYVRLGVGSIVTGGSF